MTTASRDPLSPTLERLDVAPADWQACVEHLRAVSRTFSKPIGALPGVLQIATTCGYLLCRIADTIEDEPTLSDEDRDRLFEQFLAVVESAAPAETFTRHTNRLEDNPDYATLARDLERVLRVFRHLPDQLVEPGIQWIGEMVRGMQIYTRRPSNGSGITVLHTIRDLERYCHFVAGTVGHMMTEFFTYHIRQSGELAAAQARRMRTNAEQFGLGLQLVNILKDQTEDIREGWCFIPRSLIEKAGFEDVAAYFETNDLDANHRAVEPLFHKAANHLDAALEYTLAIPPSQREIRIACLLPLWMAVQTLDHAHHNDAMFQPDTPVKISRDAVAETISECTQHATDDDYLRDRYAAMASSLNPTN